MSWQPAAASSQYRSNNRGRQFDPIVCVMEPVVPSVTNGCILFGINSMSQPGSVRGAGDV